MTESYSDTEMLLPLRDYARRDDSESYPRRADSKNDARLKVRSTLRRDDSTNQQEIS